VVERCGRSFEAKVDSCKLPERRMERLHTGIVVFEMGKSIDPEVVV
jgi:hypothetical protein